MEIPKVTRQVKLEKECELRIEVGPHSPLRLCLLNGTAEIFGTELPPRNWLTFQPRSKFAVFTWYAATLEIEGFSETEYTSDDTPMISYVNVHAVLDARRRRARSSPVNSHMSQGPRVIVVGPNDSGKTTLSKMLLSWAARLGWKPTFVDLDVIQGSITVPGCIAASPVESPIDPVNGIPLDIPLVYFNGDVTLRGKVELYKLHMNELAKVLERQCSANDESRAAGMVINTMGWKDGDGYELLLDAIDTFNANVVLVLGHDKLWIRLKEALTNKAHVDVVKLQKSGGVVSRDKKFRQEAIVWKTREYFYGLTKNLSSHSNTEHQRLVHLPDQSWASSPSFSSACRFADFCNSYEIISY